MSEATPAPGVRVCEDGEEAVSAEGSMAAHFEQRSRSLPAAACSSNLSRSSGDDLCDLPTLTPPPSDGRPALSFFSSFSSNY